MPDQTRIVAPTFPLDHVKLVDGTKVKPPADWAFLKPGDAALTRRVKEAGPSWMVKTKKGKREMSLGIWAPAETIERLRSERDDEKQDPAYLRRLEQSRQRATRAQETYVDEFLAEVRAFLAFDSAHAALEEQLARAVTTHATPVGSGTVARTKRIAVERRAEAAAIAWMRHQTTAYDHLSISRVKGKRREVRAMLAKASRQLLDRYRRDPAHNDERCPLRRALTA
ncbi:MAG: hypothetical protein ACI81R_000456 [Bradymonadia bacterium]|jgi:hypothetical protein